MQVLFYFGVVSVLIMVMVLSVTGSVTDALAVFDWLFVRGAVFVFLYLLWRFVRAYESNRR